MCAAFKPLPGGEPRLDTKQFLFRLKNDPGFAEKMQAHYESMLALPVNEDTADTHKRAKDDLITLKHHQGIWKGMQCLIQCQAIMNEAPKVRAPAILQNITTLPDEARDHFLDAPEPERTKFMAKAQGISEAIRKVAETG